MHQHPNPLLRSGLFVYVVLAHVYSDFFVTCQNMVGQPAEQKINQFKQIVLLVVIQTDQSRQDVPQTQNVRVSVLQSPDNGCAPLKPPHHQNGIRCIREAP